MKMNSKHPRDMTDDELYAALTEGDAFMNVFAIPDRTVCVTRVHEGIPTAFAIATQAHYKEWSGCYSLITC